MRLTKQEKEIILECLQAAWDCYHDSPFYEAHERDKETIRLNLIGRFKKETK